jgi:hypothetical protein
MMPTRIRLLPALLVAALVVIWSASARADYQRAKDAYDKGDYATALAEASTLAQQGDGDAINMRSLV